MEWVQRIQPLQKKKKNLKNQINTIEDCNLKKASKNLLFGRGNINIANYNSPLKMFDYLAAGRIILASRRDGITEVLKHNYNSIIVNKYNLNAWSQAINEILDHKYNVTKLRKNSILTAKKFTWDKRVSKIFDINNSLNY